jgi:hypothetical protein
MFALAMASPGPLRRTPRERERIGERLEAGRKGEGVGHPEYMLDSGCCRKMDSGPFPMCYRSRVMSGNLILEYEFSSGDDFGWLVARFETPDFCGQNGMFVQWQDLVEYGEALARYPIEAADPVIAEWGFGSVDDYTCITRIVLGPRGPTGGLLCDVSLSDYHDPEYRCRSRFTTDYPAVEQFRQQLAALMRKEGKQAVLSAFH